MCSDGDSQLSWRQIRLHDNSFPLGIYNIHINGTKQSDTMKLWAPASKLFMRFWTTQQLASSRNLVEIQRRFTTF